jgi:hypothetical protein
MNELELTRTCLPPQTKKAIFAQNFYGFIRKFAPQFQREIGLLQKFCHGEHH